MQSVGDALVAIEKLVVERAASSSVVPGQSTGLFLKFSSILTYEEAERGCHRDLCLAFRTVPSCFDVAPLIQKNTSRSYPGSPSASKERLLAYTVPRNEICNITGGYKVHQNSGPAPTGGRSASKRPDSGSKGQTYISVKQDQHKVRKPLLTGKI